MASTKITVVVALMFSVLVASVLLGPLASTITGNTGTQSVTNETITADINQSVELGGYHIATDSETVYYPDNGSYAVATQGTDYTLDTESGSLTALNNSAIADGDTLKVSYDYAATNDQTTMIVGLVPLMAAVAIIGTMAFKIQSLL